MPATATAKRSAGDSLRSFKITVQTDGDLLDSLKDPAIRALLSDGWRAVGLTDVMFRGPEHDPGPAIAYLLLEPPLDANSSELGVDDRLVKAVRLAFALVVGLQAAQAVLFAGVLFAVWS